MPDLTMFMRVDYEFTYTYEMVLGFLYEDGDDSEVPQEIRESRNAEALYEWANETDEIELLRYDMEERSDGEGDVTFEAILTGPKVYDHQARPDDESEPGDRCKDCGDDITWMGPSDRDWLHLREEENNF